MKTFSTKEWQIPDNWKIVSIGEITSDWRGGASLVPDDFKDEGFPILHKGAIQKNGKILIDEKKKTFATKEYALSNPNSIVNKSYLAATLRDLVPSGPSIGLIADLSKSSSSEYLLAQGAYGFKIDKDRVNPSYLVHLSNYQPFRGYMKRFAVGSTQIHIRTPIFQKLEIPLPPLAEQKRIAEVLDKADALRGKRRRALQKLDTLLQSVFLEMFGDPVKNPKGWEKVSLIEIAKKVTDGEHQTPARISDGIKLLSARNVKDGFIDLSQVDYISQEEYDRIIKRCNPEVGDVLISCSGTIGRVTTVEIDEKFTLVRSVALVKPNNEKIISKFLEYYLRTQYLKATMLKRANASSQANLFIGQIKELPVLLPPIDLQNQFLNKAKQIDGTLIKMKNSLGSYDNLFQSLQQKAFKGELFNSNSEIELTDEKKVWQQTSLF